MSPPLGCRWVVHVLSVHSSGVKLRLGGAGPVAHTVTEQSPDAAQYAPGLDCASGATHEAGNPSREFSQLPGNAAYSTAKLEYTPRANHQDDDEYDEKELPESDVSEHLYRTCR